MTNVRSATQHPAVAIVAGGLTVGILDLAYAIVVYTPHHPILIPQNIASGVLGRASFYDGTASAALGVVLHFFIAFCIAAVYYLASRKFDVLIRRPIASGMAYGAGVYCVMHGLVLPLSAVAHHPIPKVYVITEFVEHWFFVGLPPALAVRAWANRGLAP